MRFHLIPVGVFALIWLYSGSTLIQGQVPQETKLESAFTGRGYALCGSCNVPSGISSRASLTREDEPGDRIILSGTIYKEDGVTPDSGIVLFFYQADAGGYYHRPKEDVFHPKIFGWIRTGRDGRYEIRTIRPAPEVLEKGGHAHIHVHIFGNGLPEHFLHEFWFQGDPTISAKDSKRFSSLGTFSPVVALRKGSDGIWRGTRDIRVRPAARWRYEDE